MKLYLYVERDTWVHRLHPVVRLVGMLALFVVSFIVQKPEWHLGPTLLVAVLLLQTGGFAGMWRLRLLFVMVFSMTFLIWTVFYRPAAPAPWLVSGPLVIDRDAPWFAFGMAIKLVTFLAVGVLFLTTTRVEDFAYALMCLGVPRKLSFTFTLAFRLVPVFLDSAGTIVQAQRCRGLDFSQGGLWTRLRRYVPVIIPVFMGALRRADNMAMALEARGFQTPGARTFYQSYDLRSADAAALAVLGLLTGWYLFLWWRGALAFGA